MGLRTPRATTLPAAACVAALLLLMAAVTACSSAPPGAFPSASPKPTATASPQPTSPVASRVEGENSNTAEYSNTLVGLRFRYDAAEMVLYDDPGTLRLNGLTEGSQAALRLGYMGDNGAVMWIIVRVTPAHARKSPDALAGFASTLAAAVDDSARARLRKGSTAQGLGIRRIGGLAAYAIERRGLEKSGTYAGAPVRFRTFGLATRQHAFTIIQEVSPARFAQRFRAFDKVLETVRISDGTGT